MLLICGNACVEQTSFFVTLVGFGTCGNHQVGTVLALSWLGWGWNGSGVHSRMQFIACLTGHFLTTCPTVRDVCVWIPRLVQNST